MIFKRNEFRVRFHSKISRISEIYWFTTSIRLILVLFNILFLIFIIEVAFYNSLIKLCIMWNMQRPCHMQCIRDQVQLDAHEQICSYHICCPFFWIHFPIHNLRCKDVKLNHSYRILLNDGSLPFICHISASMLQLEWYKTKT